MMRPMIAYPLPGTVEVRATCANCGGALTCDLPTARRPYPRRPPAPEWFHVGGGQECPS